MNKREDTDMSYVECQHEYILDGICQGDNCQMIFRGEVENNE